MNLEPLVLQHDRKTTLPGLREALTALPSPPPPMSFAEYAELPVARRSLYDQARDDFMRLTLRVATPEQDLSTRILAKLISANPRRKNSRRGLMNLVANVRQCRVSIALTGDDRVLAVLPFFHIYGMTVLLNLALDRRATLVTMPRFDLAAFLTAVQDHRCTFLFIAPPIAVALAKHPMVDDFDIATVHTVFSGAAPLDGATADAAGRRINARVLQGYGMTELSPVSHAAPADRDDIPASSVGVLLPNVQAKLVDTSSGDELTGEGEVGPGELWVRGPNVMAGYLNRADATADTIDAEGFLHTGDIAVRDPGGWYTIVDRVKELIKYHGYQIAPAELEALLLSHPQIADAAVIGVSDEDGQEIPKAFVVAAGEITADDVMEFVAGHVAPHKKVRRVEFIDAIPKSTSGKILRKDLRAREG